MAIESFKISIPDEFLKLINHKIALTRILRCWRRKEWADGTPNRIGRELLVEGGEL